MIKRPRQSEKTKQKISESLKGHKVSKETRLKISNIRLKNPIKYWLGKTRSDETNKKISESNKGRIISKETRDKISKSNKGRIISKEHKNILRERMIKNNPSYGGLSKEQKEKISKNSAKVWKDKTLSLEHKTNISIATKKGMDNSETRLKLRKARAERKFPYSNTSIEIKIQDELKDRNIIFETQKYKLEGTPDIFIEPNICIFADGDYWHNYPDGRDRDRYVDKELKKQGYKVFRFWEHAINKDVKKCINMINI